ncbi:hypothetical protein P879_05911 [Paragonimus westermani]|uniref:Uncharacterized protein n=1 Tax=Paragonimus westermani TaxID=34504 RepID=A0A8T0DN09_9TREM|nr:hypothetical protein P879_05911 [Paragonimus westermani]
MLNRYGRLACSYHQSSFARVIQLNCLGLPMRSFVHTTHLPTEFGFTWGGGVVGGLPEQTH